MNPNAHEDPEYEIVRLSDGRLACKVKTNAPEAPAQPAQDASSSDEKQDFSDFKTAELKAIAEENGVKLPRRASRDAIIAALLDAGLVLEGSE